MKDIVTWRTLLGEMIRFPQERQRLAEALGVNSITLTRWATNTSHPRQEALRALPDALPAVRQQLITLIEQEFPGLFLTNEIREQQTKAIPSTFYARFMRDRVSLPRDLRGSSLCQLVLQQMVAHLDPHQMGMGVFIAECMAPSSGNKVMSLFQMMGRGTALWENMLQRQMQFFGAESYIGDALSRGYTILLKDHIEQAQLYPQQQIAGAESMAVLPILLVDRTVGCLCAFHTQPAYFSPPLLNLLQDYVNILTVAIEPERFYPLRNIELRVMPPLEEQLPFLTTFQSRVLAYLKKVPLQQQLLTRGQVEQLVWQELEQLLLSQAYTSK